MSAGVLNQEQMESLLSPSSDFVSASVDVTTEIGESAIDLPLGTKYRIMKASCRPERSVTIANLIRQHREGSKDELLQDSVTLKRGRVYWIDLAWESLKLPENVCGRGTAKSSIGRLDAMVRLVAEKESEFDRISTGGNCRIVLEVIPITFDLIVRPGMCLSQLRLIRGTEEFCTVSPAALALEDEPVLVDNSGNAAPIHVAEDDPSATPLTLDVSKDPALGFCGFVAKKPIVDADWSIDPDKKGFYDPAKYWEPINSADDKTVTIEENRFYIFRSKERFRIPGHLAVDCRAYSEGLGDIRIHYAGFAHPWFGYLRDDDPNNKKGTPLIFEVRGFTMSTILRDGAPLAKVFFRRMSRGAPKVKGKYTDQELKLSGVFAPWLTSSKSKVVVA